VLCGCMLSGVCVLGGRVFLCLFKCTVLNGKCSDLVSCSVVGCCGCCILWCLGGW